MTYLIVWETGVAEAIEDHGDLDEVLREAIFKVHVLL